MAKPKTKASVKGKSPPPPRQPRPKLNLKLKEIECEADDCNVWFKPTDPRQRYHDLKCKDRAAQKRQRQRNREAREAVKATHRQ